MQPLFLCLTENLNYALGWMVLHSLWQATLVAFVVGILNILLRKRSAQWRYWVSNVSLLLILGMSIATFCNHYDFTKEPNQIRLIPVKSEAQAQVVATLQDLNHVANQSPLSIEAFKDYFNHNLPLIVTFWILGVALFMLKLLGGLSYIFYLKKHMNFPTDEYWKDMMEKLSNRAGISKSIELVESALVKTPIVVGYFKPMILFPMGIINRLSPEEVEAILAHELAHVLRHDYLFNILQSVVEALFYYHPAVWWLSNQIRNERESACDEIAIDLINNKLNYAKALVTVQEMAHYPLLPALGFVTQDVMTQNAFTGQRKNQFILRMQRILNVPQNKSNIMEKLIATFLIVIALVGLSIAQNKSKKEVNKDETSQTTISTASETQTYSSITTTIGDGREAESGTSWNNSELKPPSVFSEKSISDTTDMDEEMRRLEKEMKVLERKMKSYEEKMNGKSADMKPYEDMMKQAELKMKPLEKQMLELEKKMKGPTTEEERKKISKEMSAVGDKMNQVGDEMSAIGDKMSGVGNGMSDVGDEMSKIGNEMNKVGDKMSLLGDKMEARHKQIFSWFFQELKKDGILKEKKCSIIMEAEIFKVNGQNLTTEQLQKYKKGIEQRLGKSLKLEFSIYFKGTLESVSDNTFDFSGSANCDY